MEMELPRPSPTPSTPRVTPHLEFALSTCFPGEHSLKLLDMASMLEKASDHGKSNFRCPAPLSESCRLPPTRADPRLSSCLERLDRPLTPPPGTGARAASGGSRVTFPTETCPPPVYSGPRFPPARPPAQAGLHVSGLSS
ncbi:hypothetical protein E2C01_070081 [Portunus trituberculatus]|uniref:Uncharacterized protein n=1 Tax=Portunus trituberculatus TaxID=210409 RepID=A0A5B7I2L2_PORTR|nr:hypothetical protein [Portunus trituberculatus]